MTISWSLLERHDLFKRWFWLKFSLSLPSTFRPSFFSTPSLFFHFPWIWSLSFLFPPVSSLKLPFSPFIPECLDVTDYIHSASLSLVWLCKSEHFDPLCTGDERYSIMVVSVIYYRSAGGKKKGVMMLARLPACEVLILWSQNCRT